MDSRSGFALAIILIAIVGLWAVWTNRFQAVLKALQTPTPDSTLPSDAGQSAAGAGGSWSTAAPANSTGTNSPSTGAGSQTPAPASPPGKTVAIGGLTITLPFGSINTPSVQIPIAGSDGLALSPYGAGS